MDDTDDIRNSLADSLGSLMPGGNIQNTYVDHGSEIYIEIGE